MTIWRQEDITRTNVTMLVSGRADCSEYLQRMGAASNNQRRYQDQGARVGRRPNLGEYAVM